MTVCNNFSLRMFFLYLSTILVNMLNADDSEEVHKLVDIDIVEKNIEKINDESTLLYHPNKSSSNHGNLLFRFLYFIFYYV